MLIEAVETHIGHFQLQVAAVGLAELVAQLPAPATAVPALQLIGSVGQLTPEVGEVVAAGKLQLQAVAGLQAGRQAADLTDDAGGQLAAVGQSQRAAQPQAVAIFIDIHQLQQVVAGRPAAHGQLRRLAAAQRLAVLQAAQRPVLRLVFLPIGEQRKMAAEVPLVGHRVLGLLPVAVDKKLLRRLQAVHLQLPLQRYGLLVEIYGPQQHRQRVGVVVLRRHLQTGDLAVAANEQTAAGRLGFAGAVGDVYLQLVAVDGLFAGAVAGRRQGRKTYFALAAPVGGEAAAGDGIALAAVRPPATPAAPAVGKAALDGVAQGGAGHRRPCITHGGGRNGHRIAQPRRIGRQRQ